MAQPLDALIIGGGIGGLAAATVLAQNGARVRLLEQAAGFAQVGSGLQISPNGLCVLRALGLEDEIRRSAVQATAVSLRTAESDRQVARLDLGRLPPEQAYFFVHRADLVDLLLTAARSAGAEIMTAQKVRTIAPGTPPSTTLDSGETLSADLIIDAGGLHSTLRSTLNGGDKPFFTGQVAWRAVVPNTHSRGPQVHVHMAPGAHVVSYPLRGGADLNIVAVQERKAWAGEGWAHPDDPANLRAAFANAAAGLTEMLARVDEVKLWGLHRHPVAQHWTGAGTALLGDAAHPTLPFLAQGANMALEDAWALASELTRQPMSRALRAYQTLRRPRTVRVIEAANGNAWRYHLRRGPIRFAAHSALRLGSTVAPGLMLGQFDWLYGYDITKAHGPD
jgi:salicylate hydroxylase